MTFPFKRWVRLGACLALTMGSVAHAAFPDRPIRLVVPFAPGGGTDILARTIAPKMAQALGQSIIIENRGGAGGNIGSDAVAKSSADGYTILFGSNTLAINAALYRKLGFDAAKDLTAIGLAATAPLVLVTSPQTGITNVQDLIASATSQPGKLNWSTPGPGTPHHLAMERFNRETGANLVHVQYKGGGPAINDLLGNHTQASILTLASVKPFIEAGRLVPLGVATASATPLLPSVAPIADQGVQGYAASLWYGLFAPAGTPPATIARLNQALNQALADAELQAQLKAQGYSSEPGSSDALQQLLRNDLASSAATVAAAGMQPLD